MTRDELLGKVTEVIQDQLDLDALQLTMDTTAADVEGWDSLANVRIMIALEQAFDVRFSTNQITSIENVGQLLDLIAGLSR
jgi:acyl carrier protein